MKATLSARARRDILIILAVSRAQFGAGAQRRYRALVQQAIADVAAAQDRPGVVRADEVRDGLRLYHIRHARHRVAARVARPRHVVVFRSGDDALVIVRVLHEAMDFRTHLEEA